MLSSRQYMQQTENFQPSKRENIPHPSPKNTTPARAPNHTYALMLLQHNMPIARICLSLLPKPRKSKPLYYTSLKQLSFQTNLISAFICFKKLQSYNAIPTATYTVVRSQFKKKTKKQQSPPPPTTLCMHPKRVNIHLR